MSQSSPVRVERRGAIAVILVDNPPVNALSQAVRAGLRAALEQVAADPAIAAVVLAGAGRSFPAGADIREFGKPLLEPSLPAVIAALDALLKPTVAALHGNALGGGCEVALACDRRIMAPGAGIGLPEVKLGILPGAGGTQRLPRLVGAPVALELVSSGRRLGAAEAVSLGLADAVAEGDLIGAAVAAAEGLLRNPPGPRVSARAVAPFDAEAFAKAQGEVKRRARGQLSPVKAGEAVALAARLPFEEGLAAERAIFAELVISDQAKALRHVFFAEREAPKVEGLAAVPRAHATVGVIGGGTMGSGIAAACADAGLTVRLVETDATAAARAAARLEELYARQVKSGRLAETVQAERLGRIACGADFAVLGGVDLVIEAVFEDLAVKQEVFRRLDAVARPGAVLATNTSYLDVDAIAAVTARPQDVCGLHFFSPANVMRLLEVVRGAATADDTLATALALGKRLGKLAVVARVGEGFIGNRIFMAYRKQMEFLLEEGCLPQQVDAALEAWGLAMGPFAVFDLTGLEIAWKTRQRQAAARDPRARYVAIPDRLCEAGRFGAKTGLGWYRHAPGARRGEADPAVEAIIEAARAEKGIVPRAFSDAEIQSRALAAMVNEACLLLQEGIAQRPSDVDVTLVNGYGFPAWRGGPLFAAEQRGLPAALRDVEALCAASGIGYAPAPLLVEAASGGKSLATVLQSSLSPGRGSG